MYIYVYAYMSCAPTVVLRNLLFKLNLMLAFENILKSQFTLEFTKQIDIEPDF